MTSPLANHEWHGMTLPVGVFSAPLEFASSKHEEAGGNPAQSRYCDITSGSPVVVKPDPSACLYPSTGGARTP